MDVGEKSKKDMVMFLKKCVGGKKGIVSAEVKFAVVSFQKTPPGMYPYFVVSMLPQTINYSNYWGSKILEAGVTATENVLNKVILNEYTMVTGYIRQYKLK